MGMVFKILVLLRKQTWRSRVSVQADRASENEGRAPRGGDAESGPTNSSGQNAFGDWVLNGLQAMRLERTRPDPCARAQADPYYPKGSKKSGKEFT